MEVPGNEGMTSFEAEISMDVPVHHDISAAYDNLNGGKAAAPFTCAYPVHDCPPGQIPDGVGGPCVAPVLDTPPVELCY